MDGDRRTDLVVLRVGENVVLRGLGDCRFERANEALGFDGGDAWTAAFSATWEDDAALPTLAIGNYLVLDDDGQQTFACHDNQLVRPDAERRRATRRRWRSRPGWCSLSMLFSDWDRSGRRDLRVSNDRHYYRDGRGAALARRGGCSRRASGPGEEGWERLRIFGMGIASYDLTDDGYPEVYLTSQADNKLQTLADAADGRPTYEDMALESRRDRAPAVRGRHDAPVDRVARRIPGRQRRLVRRPLRGEGQRGGAARSTRPATRATCSSASRTARSSRAPRRPAC